MWPTIEPFSIASQATKNRGNVRESTSWVSNREEGTCSGRYDANNADNTPQQAPTACVVRKTEEGPDHIYHSGRRKKSTTPQ